MKEEGRRVGKGGEGEETRKEMDKSRKPGLPVPTQARNVLTATKVRNLPREGK